MKFKGIEFLKYCQLKNHNCGLNLLRQMSFVTNEDAFPAIKLLFVTAKGPLPPLQCWYVKEHIFVNSSIAFPLASNISMGAMGSQLKIFLQKAACLMSFVWDWLKWKKLQGHLTPKSEAFQDIFIFLAAARTYSFIFLP